MKKIFTSLMVLATLAMVSVSCTKEINKQTEEQVVGKMKTVTVKTDIATRTTLDSNHENIVWSSGDVMKIFNNADTTSYRAPYVAGGDLLVEVPEATTEIYAHYPYYKGNKTGPESVSVYISNSQTQKNPGELNGYNYPMVAKGTVVEETVDNETVYKALISLYPVASALALNIYHSGLEGEESVKSVTITPAAANTKFTGSQVTDLTGDNITYTEAASSEPITVTLTNALALGNTKPTDKQKFDGQIYVCLAKQSYANVKFEIETTKGTYTITSTATPFDCVNNDFVPVNINLAKAQFAEPETAVDPTAYSWTLVKDALSIGDKVVIAAAESDVAMSTTQNENNRGQIAVTKSDNALTANADVQVFEVVSGSANNSFAFKCLNGDQFGKYIAAVSSSKNYMHSNSSIDANASWGVTIGSSNGVAGVVAKGSYTRNTLKYNSSSHIFSCYESGQADIVFYRAGLPSANLSFPEESYSVNIGETFSAPTLNNPYNVPVTYSSDNENIALVDANTGEVLIGDEAGTATITASFAGNGTYSATEASYKIYVVDPEGEQWVKTAIGSITASDVFVIVGGGYAVTNDNGTDSAPTAIAVTVENDALSNIPAANLQWKLTGSASAGYSFSPAGDATKFLYCSTTAQSSSNNNIRVGTGDRKVWEFDSDGYMKTKDTYTVRYFSKYNNQDWRGYTGTSNGAVALEFYVKKGGSSTPTKTLSSITVTPPTKITYAVGDTFDATGMVVTATYSDATTADVTASATTDFATQVATAGEKTVTVSYTEEGVTVTGTFSITVSASGTTTVTYSSFTYNSADKTVSGGDSIISILQEKGTSTNDVANYTSPIRFYKGHTLTIACASGYTITNISFQMNGSYTMNNVTVDEVALTNNAWSGSASEVIFVNGGAQTRFDSITVTYK